MGTLDWGLGTEDARQEVGLRTRDGRTRFVHGPRSKFPGPPSRRASAVPSPWSPVSGPFVGSWLVVARRTPACELRWMSARADQLNPAVLAALGRLELVSRWVVDGFLTGLHRSPRKGFSVE